MEYLKAFLFWNIFVAVFAGIMMLAYYISPIAFAVLIALIVMVVPPLRS